MTRRGVVVGDSISSSICFDGDVRVAAAAASVW